ncbi:MAG: hypothetical protein M0P94_04855 [Candidatus Absconditabacterales bacterium]|nr:hypothetical protein [Candidatus Absconditabacterales bacterium]
MNNKIMFQERIVEGVCKDPISFDERCFFSLETRELTKNLPKDLENRFLILKSKHILSPGEFICVNTESFITYASDCYGLKPISETGRYIGSPYSGKYVFKCQECKKNKKLKEKSC